jgi:signal transduction histidine kinase
VAHDLRTPVNAIRLLVEEWKMARDTGAMADSDEMFELLGRNLQRLNDQIKRVLDGHAKAPVQAPVFHPVCRSFELWPLVEDLILDFRSIATKEGIQVVNEIPHMLMVHADAGLLCLAMQNLLGNAFKHTPNGQVTISANAEAGCVTCCVRDTGKGIPEEMLGKVFEKNVSGAGPRGGAGLGLAIVKQAVEAHGGRIAVESQVGVGTAFSFTIPTPAQG